MKGILKKEETDLLDREFRGKLAGKSWKYEQQLDGLVRTRMVIFAMSLLVFHPILMNYLYHDFFSQDLLIERIAFSGLYLLAGALFNKFRILSIVIALIPSVLIFLTYLIIEGQFDIRKLGFTGAILLLILTGIYHHFKSTQLGDELRAQLLENQIMDAGNGKNI